MAEHPELDTSPADEARAAVEIDLKRSCPPGLWLHPPTVDSAGRVPTHEAEAKSDLDGVPAAQARPMSESAWGSDDSNRSEGMLSGKEACITRRGGGVVTSLQWDNDGEVRCFYRQIKSASLPWRGDSVLRTLDSRLS